MRLTILAGLIVGVSLAFQSAYCAQVRDKRAQAAGVVRVHAGAPWYIAMNAGHSGLELEHKLATLQVSPEVRDFDAAQLDS